VSNLLLKLHIDVRRLLFKKVRDAFGGNLRLIICGAAPLRKELVTGFNEFGIQILNGYGTTECAPVVTVNRNRFYKPDSVGITIPCCKIRIDNPDENGDGEILVNGENVMLGYYKDEEGTANAFTDGWFRTGDIGRIDDEGFVYITGRLKNIIILSNGKNVQPEELEDLLTTKLPYIKEVLVYASAPAKGMDPVITAAVFFDKDYVQNNGIQDPGSLLSADVAEINRRLPTYKQIGQVQVRPEEFQKTTTRKIKRHSVG
jgi:long-chain acyl-CoA synthetase